MKHKIKPQTQRHGERMNLIIYFVKLGVSVPLWFKGIFR